MEPITKADQLLTLLRVVYYSLAKTGFKLVVDRHVSDIICHVAVFGLILLPLDICEESTRHTLVFDAIT